MREEWNVKELTDDDEWNGPKERRWRILMRRRGEKKFINKQILPPTHSSCYFFSEYIELSSLRLTECDHPIGWLMCWNSMEMTINFPSFSSHSSEAREIFPSKLLAKHVRSHEMLKINASTQEQKIKRSLDHCKMIVFLLLAAAHAHLKTTLIGMYCNKIVIDMLWLFINWGSILMLRLSSCVQAQQPLEEKWNDENLFLRLIIPLIAARLMVLLCILAAQTYLWFLSVFLDKFTLFFGSRRLRIWLICTGQAWEEISRLLIRKLSRVKKQHQDNNSMRCLKFI